MISICDCAWDQRWATISLARLRHSAEARNAEGTRRSARRLHSRACSIRIHGAPCSAAAVFHRARRRILVNGAAYYRYSSRNFLTYMLVYKCPRRLHGLLPLEAPHGGACGGILAQSEIRVNLGISGSRAALGDQDPDRPAERRS